MASSPIGRFIRAERETIIERWLAEVRLQAAARDLEEPRVRDNVADILETIARMLDEACGDASLESGPEALSLRHARHRLEDGYSVEEVVVDHVALRQVIALVLADRGPELSFEEWLVVDRAIDRALVDTLRYFTLSRDRKLVALDRVATEVIGVSDLDEVLQRLVDVFVESVPAADVAVILIRDDGRLVRRATYGIDLAGEPQMFLTVGDGFSGRIAAERRPLALRDARTSELVKSPALKATGVRALYGVPLVHDDDVVGVAHMGSTTAHEFAEEDTLLLRALAARAAAAITQARLVDRLEREAQLRERLVAIVGHDLRTPLTAITMGAGHLAALPDVPAPVVRVAARMLRSAQRMRRIIDDILDFSRARSGTTLPLSAAPLRLDDLVRDVVQEVHMAHPDRDVRLDVRASAIDGEWDGDRLRQVLANLLDNAVTHGASERIDVVVDKEGDRARICVHNGGAPIPADTLPTLFDPFRKAPASRARRGIGLGLFIAREIARAHGGDVSVTSTEDDGTTFVVHLPIDARPDPSAPR